MTRVSRDGSRGGSGSGNWSGSRGGGRIFWQWAIVAGVRCLRGVRHLKKGFDLAASCYAPGQGKASSGSGWQAGVAGWCQRRWGMRGNAGPAGTSRYCWRGLVSVPDFASTINCRPRSRARVVVTFVRVLRVFNVARGVREGV